MKSIVKLTVQRMKVEVREFDTIVIGEITVDVEG